VWEAPSRLLDSGYERHEILHMLGRPVAAQVWEAWNDERAYDRDAHVAALRALPWHMGARARGAGVGAQARWGSGRTGFFSFHAKRSDFTFTSGQPTEKQSSGSIRNLSSRVPGTALAAEDSSLLAKARVIRVITRGD
jgi:hypothetical protein